MGKKMHPIYLSFFLFSLAAALWTTALSDLVISKLDRRIDLISQTVRVTSTLKLENAGSDSVSEILLPFPDHQSKELSYISASTSEGKGKTKSSSVTLRVEVVNPQGMPPALKWYSVSLPKSLGKGDTVTLDVLAVFTHSLKPFPEKITLAEHQLVVFQDSGHYLSPYVVKVQSLIIRLPANAKIESFTKLENSKQAGSDIKYGPYENLPSFSYSPIVVHFQNNQPFAVAEELIREIEISHWGNVQVTEYYNLVHGGAKTTGEFSRLEYQARPDIRGASSFRSLLAKLPPRAHSIYYRDEIGNISTSHLWSDSKKTELEIEPRFPMLGGWKTSFTIGYGMPLQDFLFQIAGKRFLNITFGSPINDLIIDKLIVKVVLPEGSTDIFVDVPFEVKQSAETKLSHLDMDGRPVVVLEKINAVLEHNQYFQVYYKFNSLSLLREPLMLILGFFFLFITYIVYMHADLTISKSCRSYMEKMQWEEAQAAIQQVQNIISQCLTIHDKLEASLRDLSRTGDVQSCKAVRKTSDGQLKELSKDLRPLLAYLQSFSLHASQIFSKVNDLIAKERDLQEKLMLKHTTIVDAYEKKSTGREMENRVASIQQKVTFLRQEVNDLLEVIDEI